MNIEQLQAENARLKAEVERLIEERCFLNEKLNHFVKQTVQNREQVERLRKAGDAMASCIQFNEEMEKDYEGPTLVRQCVKDWNAAKEGNQP